MEKLTTNFETVKIEYEGPIARLIMNRPEKLNAVNQQLITDMWNALSEIDRDEESKVVIVKGEGRAFGAGADLTPMPPPPPGAQSSTPANVPWRATKEGPVLRPDKERPARRPQWQDLVWTQDVNRAVTRLWYFRKPTIAQVHGYCLAFSVMWAMECDLVIASEDCLIGQPECRAQGICPDNGLWPITIGPRWSKWLLFTGDPITGKEAADIGMINKAVPADRLEEYVEWLAARISNMPMSHLTYWKMVINACFDIMGLPSMHNMGAIYDSFGHFSGVGQEFAAVGRERGLRAALDWRDQAWGGSLRPGVPLPRGVGGPLGS